MTLKIGDKVECIENGKPYGKRGTIIRIGNDSPDLFLIEYENFTRGHDGNGHYNGAICNRWWNYVSELRLLKKREMKNGELF